MSDKNRKETTHAAVPAVRRPWTTPRLTQLECARAAHAATFAGEGLDELS